MTLDKAIEILADSAERGLTTFDADYRAAQRLGIEALKRIQSYRRLHVNLQSMPLPGES